MDSDRFDRLARTLSTSGTRRRLLQFLAAVPVAGAVLSLFDEETTAGNGHHGNKGRRGGNGGKGKSRHGKKGKSRSSSSNVQPPAPGCTPDCTGTACGASDNGCGGVCACGADCDCLPGQDCLPNGSCATPCDINANPSCLRSECQCSGNIDGGPYCVTTTIIVKSCADGCPMGSVCLNANEPVCLELCPPRTP